MQELLPSLERPRPLTFTISIKNCIMDLPGYGYAKVSLEAKEKWGKMIERYLRNSAMLKLVFLLIDIRHEPSANVIR